MAKDSFKLCNIAVNIIGRKIPCPFEDNILEGRETVNAMKKNKSRE